MRIKAGENASRSEDIVCAGCGRRVHVEAGERVPSCLECGNDQFDESGQL